MTALRILSVLAWAGVLLHMVPALWSIVRGKARIGDPARLVFLSFAVVVISFNLRWLLIPESLTVQAALYLLSIAVAAFASAVAFSSGRGPAYRKDRDA